MNNKLTNIDDDNVNNNELFSTSNLSDNKLYSETKLSNSLKIISSLRTLEKLYLNNEEEEEYDNSFFLYQSIISGLISLLKEPDFDEIEITEFEDILKQKYNEIENLESKLNELEQRELNIRNQIDDLNIEFIEKQDHHKKFKIKSITENEGIEKLKQAREKQPKLLLKALNEFEDCGDYLRQEVQRNTELKAPILKRELEDKYWLLRSEMETAMQAYQTEFSAYETKIERLSEIRRPVVEKIEELETKITDNVRAQRERESEVLLSFKSMLNEISSCKIN